LKINFHLTTSTELHCTMHTHTGLQPNKRSVYASTNAHARAQTEHTIYVDTATTLLALRSLLL